MIDDSIALDLDGPQWRFALALYSAPGVAPACLALQERAGLDVVLMIALLHAAGNGRKTVTPEDIAALAQAVAPWREAAVLPLRMIRQALKSEELARLDKGVRDQVKKAELLAEQVELAHLERLTGGYPSAASRTDAQALAALIADIVGPEAESDLLAPHVTCIAEAAAGLNS